VSGIADLHEALGALRERFELDSVSATTAPLPDGHQLTVTVSAQLFSIEREDGHAVLVERTS
jgi:hypothetical protein